MYAEMTSSSSRYLETAIAIGDELAQSAVRTPSGVGWMGDDLLGSDEATLAVVRRAVGPDLYSGTAGIGWFLGHLAASVPDARTATLAADALTGSLAAAEEGLPAAFPSLCTGAAGVALLAIDVAGRLRLRRLERAALQLARRVAAGLPDRLADAGTVPSDLMGGLAGVVVSLLAIHGRAPDPALLKGCRLACERLLADWKADGAGTLAPDPRAHAAWCGLGHGASGIAWALAEAGWRSRRHAMDAAVQEALRYERGWFSAERCAWADLREPPPSSSASEWPAWTTAWCHGAIGIGAVRLRMYEQTGEITALAEASAALQAARVVLTQAGAALRLSQFADVTICHGLGGAIDLMLLASEITGMREHQRAARRGGDLCLAIRAANGGRWTVGLRGAELVPGLFLGLAGIGVLMMRLHDPSSIASPLLAGRQRRAASRAHVVKRIASRST